jgi:ABC-type multidrug transport system fused ATPase/permease subunit
VLQVFGVERALSAALSCVDRGAKAWLILLVALEAAERVTLVAATCVLVQRGPFVAAMVAVGLAGLVAVRRLSSASLRARAQAGAYRAAARALLRADPMDTTPLGSSDPQNVLHECTWVGADLVATQVPEAVGDALAALVIGAWLVVTQEAPVLLVGALALLASVVGLLVARRVTGAALARSWAAQEPIYDAMTTIVKGRLELCANGVGDAAAHALEARLAHWEREARAAGRLAGAAGRAPLAAATLTVAAVVLTSARLRGAVEHVALGEAAIVASAVPAFTGLLLRLAEAMRSAARFEPMVALLGLAPRATMGGAMPPELPAPIVAKDVSYTYPRAERPAVVRTSFVWEPGDVLVLRGPNGAGKSTLLRVLAGVAVPSRGEVRVGGIPLADLDRHALGAEVAFLSQEAALPETSTVASAMAVLAPEAGADAWRRALEGVELWSVLVEKSPGAPLEVTVGALSAGQRQRVALARVLCREAPLVFLDEPDASLDAEGLEVLARVVRERKGRQMFAIAAHSPRLAALADVLVDLDPARSP